MSNTSAAPLPHCPSPNTQRALPLRSEPNDNFWRGGEDGGLSKQASYFELYTQAALALKNASSKLRVGGPATCCADCWIGDFVRHMDNHSVPYDFVSTHAYSSCQMAGLGDVEKVVKEIGVARSDLNNVTASNHPNHPNGKTPPWIITGRGSTVGEGALFLRTTPNFIENP